MFSKYLGISLILCVIINGQTIFTPTISNASGQFYITATNGSLSNGQINCNTNLKCSIQCLKASSCKNTAIYCNNAANCNILCSDPYDIICKELTIYISNIGQTNIICNGDFDPVCSSLTIYTDYTNYPLAYTDLLCVDEACDAVYIKDITTLTNAYNPQIRSEWNVRKVLMNVISQIIHQTKMKHIHYYYHQ